MVDLDFNFKFYDKEYNQVSISKNGYICLGNNTACDSPKRPSPHNIIVGLNYDLDPSREGSGQIYYKKLSSDSDIIPLSINVFGYYYFMITNIFLITYDNVLTSDKTSNLTVSFQIFLITEDARSYVKFKYTSCPKFLKPLASSGVNYKNNMDELQEVVIENDSECTLSNVMASGIWLMNVTNTAIGKKKSYEF